MKHFFKSIVVASLVFSGASFAESDSAKYWDSYTSAVSGGEEDNISPNAFEVALEAKEALGINGIMSDVVNGVDNPISVVEALMRTDYIFSANIKSHTGNPDFDILTYEDILKHFNERSNRLPFILNEGGNFLAKASAKAHYRAGWNIEDKRYNRPFKNFKSHSLVATALASCDLELTEFLIKKGADLKSKGLDDTYAFFKVFDGFGEYPGPVDGDAIYNHHRVVTPFNLITRCLSIRGYYQGDEWIEYPEDNPIQPYMENFAKVMLAHYLKKPELNLNEFGCLPVIKSSAYENKPWVRKLFTDKFGADFAEKCEKNNDAYDKSCKSVLFPNGSRDYKCSLRKY